MRSDPFPREDLIAGLKDAGASFESGELSYLALTSKVEHAVRDRLAWALSKRGHRVAREWRRTDLAVLNDAGDPLVALEAKATYTHDVRWGMTRTQFAALQAASGGTSVLEAKIRADALKALLAAGAGSAYVLLIAMDRLDRVPVELKLVSEAGPSPGDWPAVEPQLIGYLEPLGQVSDRIVIGEGSAFGIGMTVSAWLGGPITPFETWHTAEAGADEDLGALVEERGPRFQHRPRVGWPEDE